MLARDEYDERKNRHLDDSTDRDALMNIARKWMARTHGCAIPGTAPGQISIKRSGRYAPIIRRDVKSEGGGIPH